MADKENKEKPKVDLGLLEEDDEFEEFPAEGNLTLFTEWSSKIPLTGCCFVYLPAPCTDWTGNKEDEEELSVWEDNWDDDNVEDDFNQQLRAQLEKQKSN